MADVVGKHYALQDASGPRSGGLSVVRRGVDTRDLTPVAVKFISGRGDDKLQKKVFEREVKTLRSLNHPNIVRYRDSGIDDTDTYYLVLDWVDRNLNDALTNPPWDSWDDFYRMFGKPLTGALAYAHLNQVEHRDIKPANVLIADDGSPLLADFGIAKIRGEKHESELTVVGFRSGPYAPPEYDSKIPYVRDVYSMGVLFLQCLWVEKIADFPDIARALDAVDMPPDVRKLLERCVHHDASERPANASVLVNELHRVNLHRAADRRQATHYVVLGLTNRAVDALSPERHDRPVASAAILGDLAGDVFATYRFDHESGEHDRETILLVGKENRYTLKTNENRTSFVVVGVAKPDFEQLEALRRRAHQLLPIFTWATSEPANRTFAKRGFDKFVDALEQHLERQEIEDDGVSVEVDSLFDIWARSLDARVEIAQGALEPMRYTDTVRQGHLTRFDLRTAAELDLIGTEWQARDPHTDRSFGWGEVADQDGSSLYLLGRNFSPSLPKSATLVPHIGPTEVAIQRQRDAVANIRGGLSTRSDLREILADPALNRKPVPEVLSNLPDDLDESKREAVASALGSPDMLVVQGPPGTGKTSFIAETVSQFLHANPGARVLIASQTHVAVDNALERLSRRGITGLVRLAGRNEATIDPAVRHLLLDAQTRRWGDEVRRRAEASLDARAQDRGIPAAHLRAALVLHELADFSQQLEAIQQRLESAPQEAEEHSDLATSLDLYDQTPALQERVDSLTDLRAELSKRAESALAGDLTIPTRMGSEDARAAIAALLGDTTVAQRLLEQVAIQANWLQRIGSDESLESVFLETTTVVAGTCVGFLRNRAVRLLDFDLCIVDEASKATATEVLVPLSRAKRWILVGDTNQLAPTDEELLRAEDVLREHELTKADVTQTLFQRMTEQLPDHSKRALLEQYRMIRPIGDLISTCFYDGTLRSPRAEGLQGYEQTVGRPVLWLDTSGLGERRRESAPAGQVTSYANRTEATLVIEHLKVLDGATDLKLLKPKSQDGSLEVLVITPYRSQVDELKRRLSRQTLRHLRPVVMSVDAVQGREADIAVFSLTRSNAEGRLGFLSAEYWRRINVALSRARYGLTIVGDAEFTSRTRGALRTVLDYVKAHPEDCELREASLD